MCNCPESPWVRNANTFLRANQNSVDGRWHTINYLIINGHCGIDRRTTIDSILGDLSSHGITLSREAFQQEILGDLKRQGIVATLVYPGPQGGVFIPCCEDEIRTAANQVLNRIDSELGNLEGIAQLTPFGNLFPRFRRYLDRLRRRI